MPELSPLVTAAELARIAARDGYRYDRSPAGSFGMSQLGWQHGAIVMRLLRPARN